MSLHAVDLFSGAGGLSCGFRRAGFEIILSVEQDSWASETFILNHPSTKVLVSDIRNISDRDFSKFKGVDVVMGGPPCQGFSISASNRRHPNDPRNLLYMEFLRAVAVIKPRFVLIENVKEMRKFRLERGALLSDDIKERLAKMDYESEILTLNASAFGVPQTRLRTFILAAKKVKKFFACIQELELHSAPIGPLFTRSQPIISLWDAISDLPPVSPWELSEDSIAEYRIAPLNEYQRAMRQGSKAIYNHVPMRHTERIVARFQHLINTPENEILPLFLSPRTRGNPAIVSNKTFHQNHRKLAPNKPSPTITASFYSSFIHPFQPRNLTVREAARLQSFPDNFIFKGKRTTLSKKLLKKKGVQADLHLDQFNQVGNSVPPILAETVAKTFMKMLGT